MYLLKSDLTYYSYNQHNTDWIIYLILPSSFFSFDSDS